VIRYIVRRLLASIPVVFGVVGIVFVLARIIPGDPCRSALGERATDEICAAFITRYGLDEPIPLQFVHYLGQIVTGDLGESIQRSRPVMDILMERLPVTMELTLFALLFSAPVLAQPAPPSNPFFEEWTTGFGMPPFDRIRAEHWADRLGTIGYEIVCGIGARIPRRIVGR